MDITPLVDPSQKIIQSYRSGKFKISGDVYDCSVLVAPHHATEWVHADELCLNDFQPLIDVADSIDVVLLGTGEKTVFLAPELKQALRENGLHVESMDTGAACRTYNVLMSEARRVVAALLPVT
ncbi:MAG: Mth938-like domain-containing protein [Alphaproteobacteria bacterium]|nr:Mth938-like domain-containing protein [Alphaproteobacteria bacterium]